ncbi:MAG: hypothetical protein JSV66_14925 [Trueperaceae bacterium]|nr:MAG: hypothetical protein JSV66_14925 [Trueperaceae bacterium]
MSEGDTASVVGFAFGVGVGVLVITAPYLQFAFSDQNAFLLYAISFAAGAVPAGAWMAQRGRRG